MRRSIHLEHLAKVLGDTCQKRRPKGRLQIWLGFAHNLGTRSRRLWRSTSVSHLFCGITFNNGRRFRGDLSQSRKCRQRTWCYLYKCKCRLRKLRPGRHHPGSGSKLRKTGVEDNPFRQLLNRTDPDGRFCSACVYRVNGFGQYPIHCQQQQQKCRANYTEVTQQGHPVLPLFKR